jgi:hypothetical protein
MENAGWYLCLFSGCGKAVKFSYRSLVRAVQTLAAICGRSLSVLDKGVSQLRTRGHAFVDLSLEDGTMHYDLQMIGEPFSHRGGQGHDCKEASLPMSFSVFV